MAEKSKPIDWTDPHRKDMLVYQRKSMWLDDTIEKLAAWLGLKQGWTTVDVGCGLGYIGYTWWPYFGEDGRYIGVDNAAKLIDEARQAASQWAPQRGAEFIVGDAYQLPLPDNFADWVVCQTLLMHLAEPEKALAEMIRVVKPGSLITCFEPDNLSVGLGMPSWSVPQRSLEVELLSSKIHLISCQGRIKLGRGDESIGRKLPHLFSQAGLIDIDMRVNDRVGFMEPPYEGAQQQRALENLRKFSLDDEMYDMRMDRAREEFLAGGGDPKEFDRVIEIGQETRAIMKEQIEAGTFYSCFGSEFYCARGRKAGISGGHLPEVEAE
ncbi:MAG: methyltransferase domain-containing protein [bacterium]